jgi:hypothetical protein
MKTYKVIVTDKATKWYNESNQLHREDGPAIEWAKGSKAYYINGNFHREDGPAIEWADGYKSYYINREELKEKEFKIVIVDGITYKLVKI